MNNKLKLSFLKVFAISLVVSLVFYLASPAFLKEESTVRAVGDLSVDWGVPEGSPIFVISNMAPGQEETEQVVITNNAATARPIGIRGVKTSETNNFSTVLDITISQGGTDLYGGTTDAKTLAQFFTDSTGPSGIELLTVPQSGTATLDVKVKFQETAGNDFQNSTIVFDIVIGIAIDIPAECNGFAFTGTPIFGTLGNDDINGTNGNDLIFALEGNDRVKASNGNDCVVGGPGNDRLEGSNGNDILVGEDGNDILDGSNGNDSLSGGAGNDELNGSNGNDQISGGEGNDTITGSNGADTLDGGPGNDTLSGGNGNDNLQGGLDADSANGNLGTDTCSAETEINCEI